MTTALRYYSKGGNTKKIADAIAQATGLEAKPVSEPLTEDTDTLLLCVAPYKFNIDSHVKDFISAIHVKVGRIVLFSTSASVRPVGKYLEKLLAEKNIPLEKEEFYCPGKFLMMHNGRPNADDCQAAVAFAKKIIASGE